MTNKFDGKEINKIAAVIISDFKENEVKINNLNVFPVPDGDTGTNMLLTLKSIQQELQKLDEFTIKNIAEKISYGALMGARGNSGVILSQILKGFLDEISQFDEIDMESLKHALRSAMELAYSSVQNPTEGTMLTTIKDISQWVDKLDGASFSYVDLLEKMIEETEKSVLRTTFLLPVLKQANVVDAGAQGILEMLIGLKNALKNSNNPGFAGKNIKNGNNKKSSNKEKRGTEGNNVPGDKNEQDIEAIRLKKLDLLSDIKNIYCTEMIIKGNNVNIIRLREDIEVMGDSALIVGNEKVVKIHVHTNYPNKVLQRSLREGTLHDIQINNMIDQTKRSASSEMLGDVAIDKKMYGLIAICNGDGFEEIFKSIGVDYVIKGGQSMNPSTYEIVKAINKLNSEIIILLPNNKNIILTASQAKKISKRYIEVLPTTTIPQGISAILGFNPDSEIEENMQNMEKMRKSVKTGEITAAVRDANLLVGEIKKGAYIGLFDGKVKVISENVIDAVIDLARDMISGEEEVVTFYLGKDVNSDNNKIIEKEIKDHNPGIEIEFHNGGQPLYPYIFSIE